MKISLNEIKKLVKIPKDVSTSDLVQLIGSRLVEVEAKIPLAPKYEKSMIVKVTECELIEGTHLHLCQIDAGGTRTNTVQVVCGAPNVHKGMLAVWLQPGAIVPQTYGGEDFQLSVRKLRGYESNGMLASIAELDLGEDHSGIVEVDPKMQWNGRTVRPGDSFAEVFNLNDIILDIENKSLTHRPDTFGLIGFAREVAGILGVKFSEPNFSIVPTRPGAKGLKITIKDPALCPRYSCAVIELDDATTDDKYLTPSDIFLAKAGMHGISKIVDVTNILMLMTGQPLHAFDYDKFLKIAKGSPEIIVRSAKDGEELQLLDGKTISCTKNDILITANNTPVALAGAMGGASTMIDASTKRVLLESASFSLYNLRKTQMHHGIFSEAITRFTKGVPSAGTVDVLDQAIKQLGGKAVAFADAYPGRTTTQPITVTLDEINSLLGTTYTAKTVVKTLDNVGIKTGIARVTALEGDPQRAERSEHVGGGKAGRTRATTIFNFSVPTWRTDLHIKDDIIEEVGRLLGYDNIPQTLPLRPFIGATPDPIITLKSTIRNVLSNQLSAHEILTYSFVSRDLQVKVEENPTHSYEIVNSISPELQCFRQSLIPSILEKIYDNLKAGYQDFTLYELNQVTDKTLKLTFENVPQMESHLGLVTLGDFYQAKALLLGLAKNLHLELDLKPFKSGAKYLEPAHSAEVYLGKAKLGHIGELRGTVLRQLKLPTPIAAFELNLEALLSVPAQPPRPLTLSKFPSVERDLTVRVKAEQTFGAVSTAISTALARHERLLFTISPASLYQDDQSHKNLSFHLNFVHLDKTLSGDEISAIMKDITNNLQKMGAAVI
ncbi:phenylalanine--tRNA ligase subunit beta [Candidatus Saccharibacteria bacterium]|nr:phenylalanine--tRNA ligase subunit beta [Candidatus Saccharibacteria bacterium]